MIPYCLSDAGCYILASEAWPQPNEELPRKWIIIWASHFLPISPSTIHPHGVTTTSLIIDCHVQINLQRSRANKLPSASQWIFQRWWMYWALTPCVDRGVFICIHDLRAKNKNKLHPSWCPSKAGRTKKADNRHELPSFLQNDIFSTRLCRYRNPARLWRVCFYCSWWFTIFIHAAGQWMLLFSHARATCLHQYSGYFYHLKPSLHPVHPPTPDSMYRFRYDSKAEILLRTRAI